MHTSIHQTTQPMTNLDTALRYAALGWKVFPVIPGTKQPMTAHGFQDATTDAEAINRWWKRQPDANIGLDCGGSGLIAIDVDSYKLETPDLCELLGVTPEELQTPTQATQNGGLHLVYRLPEGLEPSNRRGALPKGIDVRGDGYIVVEPSVGPNGHYKWVLSPFDCEPRELPQAILDKLQTSRPSPAKGLPPVRGEVPFTADPLERAAATIRSAGAGNTHDPILRHGNRIAGLLAGGQLSGSFEEVRAYLLDAVRRSGSTTGERTLEDALRYGLQRPLFPLTEIGNGKRLAFHYRDQIRRDGINNQWMVWDGRRWTVDTTNAVQRYAEEIVRRIPSEAGDDLDRYRELLDFTKWSSRVYQVEQMVKAAGWEEDVALEPSALDADPWALNVGNGTIDLRTGALRPHTPSAHHSKLVDVAYDRDAACPQWETFLKRITGGDQALITYLQRAVGYSLTGSVEEQCFFFAFGEGRNGKSTFFETMMALFGDYAKRTSTETLMVRSNADRTANDLAELPGARLVAAEEIPQGARLNESVVKTLTGGDTMTARKLYGRPFEYKPQLKLWFYGNYKPVVRGSDLGIWRRMVPIPFTQTIPLEEVDKQLPEKLRAELPGILAWAVRGCLAWQREGLPRVTAIEDAYREYREEMDVIGQFIEECCVVNSREQVSFDDLYKVYRRRSEANGEYVQNVRNFGDYLTKRGFKKEKHGGRVIRFGIGLTYAAKQTYYVA